MTKNMGDLDRGGRLVIAVAVLVLAFGTTVLGAGALFWIALVAAVIFTVTAFVGNCPLYSILGIKTCRVC